MDTAESADIAVRVWPGKYSIDDVTTPNGKTFRLINLPFYYVGMIDKILDKATDWRETIQQLKQTTLFINETLFLQNSHNILLVLFEKKVTFAKK